MDVINFFAAIDLSEVQFLSVVTKLTCAARSLNFEMPRLLISQIAIPSVQ